MSENPTDADLIRILNRTKVIAVVGASTNPVKASHFVLRYMHYRNYQVIPVNPGQAGKTLFGETIRASLADCPKTVDMIDIFRPSEFVPPIIDAALEQLPNLKTIWMQIGVTHAQAATKARDAGVEVVQNLCPKMEYQRLFGELRKAGIRTDIITSKLPNWR